MSNMSGVRDIERVAVVNDNDDSRETTSAELASVNFVPKMLLGPYSQLAELVSAVMAESQAAVCDHHLSTRGFAFCTGAEAVATLYRERFPAVLVTNWSKADFDLIRTFRRGVPVLMTPTEIDPEAIKQGFKICIDEFRGEFLPIRQPWQALVQIEEVDMDDNPPIVKAVVPSWSSLVVRFPLSLIPEHLQRYAKPENRFFAKVNTGAEDEADLYFDEFEFRG